MQTIEWIKRTSQELPPINSKVLVCYKIRGIQHIGEDVIKKSANGRLQFERYGHMVTHWTYLKFPEN